MGPRSRARRGVADLAAADGEGLAVEEQLDDSSSVAQLRHPIPRRAHMPHARHLHRSGGHMIAAEFVRQVCAGFARSRKDKRRARSAKSSGRLANRGRLSNDSAVKGPDWRGVGATQVAEQGSMRDLPGPAPHRPRCRDSALFAQPCRGRGSRRRWVLCVHASVLPVKHNRPKREFVPCKTKASAARNES
jgi:hypothetical protein